MWQKIEVKSYEEEERVLENSSSFNQKDLPSFWLKKVKKTERIQLPSGEKIFDIDGNDDYCFVLIKSETEKGIKIGISGSEDDLLFVPESLQDLIDYAEDMKKGIEEEDYDEEDCVLPYPVKETS